MVPPAPRPVLQSPCSHFPQLWIIHPGAWRRPIQMIGASDDGAVAPHLLGAGRVAAPRRPPPTRLWPSSENLAKVGWAAALRAGRMPGKRPSRWPGAWQTAISLAGCLGRGTVPGDAPLYRPQRQATAPSGEIVPILSWGS